MHRAFSIVLRPFQRRRILVSELRPMERPFHPASPARSQAFYGDTSVRTLGALRAKIDDCLTRTALYGLTRDQVRSLMAPNDPADADLCIAQLVREGRATVIKVAGSEFLFENTQEAKQRARVSLASLGYKG